MRDAMIASWSAFARTGDPSNPVVGQWPAFTLDKRQVMRLDARSAVIADPLGPDVRKVWDSMPL